MYFRSYRGHTRGLGLLFGLASAAIATPCAAQSLSEAQAVERALAQSDFAEVGAAERDAAAARVDSIRRFDNPEITLSRERVTGSGGDETEWQAGLSQPFDISGRRSSLRAAARAEAHAVDAEVARRRQQRVAEVRRAYAACAAAQDKAAVASGFAAKLREAERVVTDRAEVGDTSFYDMRRLRVEARTAAAEERLAAGETTAACAILAELTGVEQARPSIGVAVLVNPGKGAAGFPTRADLVALEQRLLAATQTVQAARRARLPEVRLGLGYKRVDALGGSASGPAISVGATIPLFNNGGAVVREAQARERAQQAELALARRKADSEIAAASARALAAVEAAGTATTARDDASRLGTIAETAYQSGEIGVVDLVDAYRTARDAETSIITLTERAVGALIDLDLARGVDP